MSGGKSTIVNALLGKKILPSSNRACTANIISVENYDAADDDIWIGQLRSDGKVITRQFIAGNTLDDWNVDAATIQIWLTAKFCNVNRSITLHDTPGTNFSQDRSHERITKEFLSQYPLDVILFVINAEHSGTFDEKQLLTWIKKNVIDKRKTKILFLINKADSLDPEHENIFEHFNDTRRHLMRLGFDKPKLIALSARAALLFRMVINNQHITPSEAIAFESYHQRFAHEEFVAYNATDIVIVDDIICSRSNLCRAVFGTGICELESILDQRISLE